MLILILLGIPLAAVVFFFWEFNKYRAIQRKSSKEPGTVLPSEIRRRKVILTVASVISATLVAVVVGFAVLLTMAIAHM